MPKNSIHKTKQPEYYCWQNMKARCYNPGFKNFKNWGGRGITVCPEWRNDFWRFVADVGPRPSPKHSIDRHPDNDGNYEPGNVRWATYEEQLENKRTRSDSVQMTLNEVTKSQAEWARTTGISEANIKGRRRMGWSDERILSTPVRKCKPR